MLKHRRVALNVASDSYVMMDTADLLDSKDISTLIVR
jgi:hypothetical protein